MNPHNRLRELEAELLEIGLTVRLSLTPSGIRVSADQLSDRLIAEKELKDRGLVVDKPWPAKPAASGTPITNAIE